MPDLRFKSMGCVWRVKGQAEATIEEDNVQKDHKHPTTYQPPVSWGTAEGGLYSSGYHDGTAFYSNSDGLHLAQAVRSEGWCSSSAASSPVFEANIRCGGIHEVSHNISGTAPPVIETVAGAYSAAYIWRSYKVDDANEGSFNMVNVLFQPSSVGPITAGKVPTSTFKMFMAFADTWMECNYDPTMYGNQGGWHVKHKLRSPTGAWLHPGDHIYYEDVQSLNNYWKPTYFVYQRGQIFAATCQTNDFDFINDAAAQGSRVEGRSNGVSGASPVSTGNFRPQCEVLIERVFVSQP